RPTPSRVTGFRIVRWCMADVGGEQPGCHTGKALDKYLFLKNTSDMDERPRTVGSVVHMTRRAASVSPPCYTSTTSLTSCLPAFSVPLTPCSVAAFTTVPAL